MDGTGPTCECSRGNDQASVNARFMLSRAGFLCSEEIKEIFRAWHEVWCWYSRLRPGGSRHLWRLANDLAGALRHRQFQGLVSAVHHFGHNINRIEVLAHHGLR